MMTKMEKDNPNSRELIYTKIWEEEAEPDNPFAASNCFCAGYDVYEDLLGNASWIEYLYLLFKQERPNPDQTRLLEGVAVALANPGPRDPSVHAAMCASAGGSPAASALMAALASGAGVSGGAREIVAAMQCWQENGRDLDSWIDYLQQAETADYIEIWPDRDHAAGFEPHLESCLRPVKITLHHLCNFVGSDSALIWLRDNRIELEQKIGLPVSMCGVASAAFVDLDLNSQDGEMLYLLLRLPGAAAHALENYMQYKKFPFFDDKIELLNDPESQ